MVTGRRFPPPWHVVEHAGNRLIRLAPPNLKERTGLTIPEAQTAAALARIGGLSKTPIGRGKVLDQAIVARRCRPRTSRISERARKRLVRGTGAVRISARIPGKRVRL
jgi:hypothetical protein